MIFFLIATLTRRTVMKLIRVQKMNVKKTPDNALTNPCRNGSTRVFTNSTKAKIASLTFHLQVTQRFWLGVDGANLDHIFYYYQPKMTLLELVTPASAFAAIITLLVDITLEGPENFEEIVNQLIFFNGVLNQACLWKLLLELHDLLAKHIPHLDMIQEKECCAAYCSQITADAYEKDLDGLIRSSYSSNFCRKLYATKSYCMLAHQKKIKEFRAASSVGPLHLLGFQTAVSQFMFVKSGYKLMVIDLQKNEYNLADFGNKVMHTGKVPRLDTHFSRPQVLSQKDLTVIAYSVQSGTSGLISIWFILLRNVGNDIVTSVAYFNPPVLQDISSSLFAVCFDRQGAILIVWLCQSSINLSQREIFHSQDGPAFRAHKLTTRWGIPSERITGIGCTCLSLGKKEILLVYLLLERMPSRPCVRVYLFTKFEKPPGTVLEFVRPFTQDWRPRFWLDGTGLKLWYQQSYSFILLSKSLHLEKNVDTCKEDRLNFHRYQILSTSSKICRSGQTKSDLLRVRSSSNQKILIEWLILKQ